MTPNDRLTDPDVAVDGPNAAAEFALWRNPEFDASYAAAALAGVNPEGIAQAQSRLQRFAPLLEKLFPELQATGGLAESPLLPVAANALWNTEASQGQFWIKADHQLAVAGSIKARGGFHEVLEFAERIAQEHQLLTQGQSYAALADAPARAVFSQYEVAVGSTGNLGMSIGMMAAGLGFQATVHMSCEAKEWKKNRLRAHGVTVHEYAGDYGLAVEEGRRIASLNARSHFVDDERSTSLFYGYAVAAYRLQNQLKAAHVVVDEAHPLFVYLPCGVGGAPGGVVYGLKQVFGAAVHCFFVEPATSACFLVQMQHPEQPGISIYDVGQDNRTIADGLAVPCASQLVYPLMRPLLSGIVTTTEDSLRANVWRMQQAAQVRVEPSAAASLSGLRALLETQAGQAYLDVQGLGAVLPQANHILWTTGGALMPDSEYLPLLEQGRRVHEKAA